MSFNFQVSSKGYFIVVDYIILLSALFGNLFALNAIARTSFGLQSYRLFLLSLAASDLFLCTVNLLSLANQALADTIYAGDLELTCMTNILRSLLLFGTFGNLFNLCGMSFDHFIGIVYPLRYRYMLNKSIARSAIAVVWLLAFLSGFADMPILTAVYLNRGKVQVKPSSVVSSASRAISNCSSQLSSTSTAASLRSFNNYAQVTAFQPLRSKVPDLPYGSFIDWDAFDVSDLARVVEDKLNKSLFNSRSCTQEELTKEKEFLLNLEDYNARRQIAENNWCVYVNENKIWLELFVVFWTLVSFGILALCYGRIFKMVVIQRKNRSIRKLIMTTCLLLGIFAICWLPLMIFEIAMWAIVWQSPGHRSPQQSDSLLVIHNVFNTLFLCHPLVNPIIYVARLPNVQRSILRRYSAFLPCCRKYAERTMAQQLVLSMTYSLRKISHHRPSSEFARNNSSNMHGGLSMNTLDEFDQAILNYGNQSTATFATTVRNHTSATISPSMTASRQESSAGGMSATHNSSNNNCSSNNNAPLLSHNSRLGSCNDDVFGDQIIEMAAATTADDGIEEEIDDDADERITNSRWDSQQDLAVQEQHHLLAKVAEKTSSL